MTDDWAEHINLPGPTNFVADVVESLDAGRSAVVVLPDHVADSTASDHILRALVHRSHGHEVDPHHDRGALASAVEELFGLHGHWRSSPDFWRDLTHAAVWRGECVVARGSDYELGGLLTRWGSLISEQSVDPVDRPRLLLVVRRRDLDEGVLERVDLLHVAVHWWWGVIDRLDTEAFLARRATRFQRDPLRRAVMTEVAGWDLALGGHLLDYWDGEVEHLVEAMRRFRPAEPSHRPESGRPASAPTLQERSAWDDGIVESWDGGRRASPWSAEGAVLRGRIWRAQNRVFMPRLDERRAELEREFLAMATPSMQSSTKNEDGICELGRMRWASDNGARMSAQSRAALSVLTQLRNALAHGRPADARLLAQVRGHL